MQLRELLAPDLRAQTAGRPSHRPETASSSCSVPRPLAEVLLWWSTEKAQSLDLWERRKGDGGWEEGQLSAASTGHKPPPRCRDYRLITEI